MRINECRLANETNEVIRIPRRLRRDARREERRRPCRGVREQKARPRWQFQLLVAPFTLGDRKSC